MPFPSMRSLDINMNFYFALKKQNPARWRGSLIERDYFLANKAIEDVMSCTILLSLFGDVAFGRKQNLIH